MKNWIWILFLMTLWIITEHSNTRSCCLLQRIWLLKDTRHIFKCSSWKLQLWIHFGSRGPEIVKQQSEFPHAPLHECSSMISHWRYLPPPHDKDRQHKDICSNTFPSHTHFPHRLLQLLSSVVQRHSSSIRDSRLECLFIWWCWQVVEVPRSGGFYTLL